MGLFFFMLVCGLLGRAVFLAIFDSFFKEEKNEGFTYVDNSVTNITNQNLYVNDDKTTVTVQDKTIDIECE